MQEIKENARGPAVRYCREILGSPELKPAELAVLVPRVAPAAPPRAAYADERMAVRRFRTAGEDRSAAVRYSIPGPIGPMVIIEFRPYGRHHGLPFCVCNSLSLGGERFTAALQGLPVASTMNQYGE